MNSNSAIDERAYFLQLERDLSDLHIILGKRLKTVSVLEEYDIEAPIQSALWALGVAVLQVTRRVAQT